MGVGLALAGILLVQGVPFAVGGSGFSLAGMLLVLCAALCESLFTVMSRKIQLQTVGKKQFAPLVQAELVSVFAMFLCLAPALLERPLPAVHALPPSGWAALVWYGSVVTVVAFAFMFAGATRSSGYTIAAFAGVIPIGSTILSVVVLKEPVRLHQILGCALVVLATLVIAGE